MWKQLMTTGLLAATLVVLPAVALADHRDNRDNRAYRDSRDGWEHRDDRRHWDRRDTRRHWRQQQRQQWRWRNRNRHYWNGRWYNSPPGIGHRSHIGWGPSYFGRLLIGPTINYRLLHDRNDHRYCDHRRRGHRR